MKQLTVSGFGNSKRMVVLIPTCRRRHLKDELWKTKKFSISSISENSIGFFLYCHSKTNETKKESFRSGEMLKNLSRFDNSNVKLHYVVAHAKTIGKKSVWSNEISLHINLFGNLNGILNCGFVIQKDTTTRSIRKKQRHLIRGKQIWTFKWNTQLWIFGCRRLPWKEQSIESIEILLDISKFWNSNGMVFSIRTCGRIHGKINQFEQWNLIRCEQILKYKFNPKIRFCKCINIEWIEESFRSNEMS
jgi:hypothetical protein